MFKTMTTIVLTVIGLLFGMQNFDHVPVYIFWGKAIQIRLIFVVAIAGVGGYLIRHFIGMAREDALRRRFMSLKMNSTNRRTLKKRADEYDDDDEF
jgi:uncharacterized integral membrane protein